MATRAYRRAALKELHAMKGSRAHEHAAVGARLQRLCIMYAVCHVAAYAHKVCELCRVLHVVVQATNVSEV